MMVKLLGERRISQQFQLDPGNERWIVGQSRIVDWLIFADEFRWVFWVVDGGAGEGNK